MKELILKLLQEGYSIWVEIVPESNTIILQGQHDLMKCLIRKVYMSNDIPRLPLRGSRNEEQPLLPYECTHVLAWSDELKEIWLIPFNLFDPGQRFARLTAKFTPYLITNIRVQANVDQERFRKKMMSRSVQRIVERERTEKHQRAVADILKDLGDETIETPQTQEEIQGPTDSTECDVSEPQPPDDTQAN